MQWIYDWEFDLNRYQINETKESNYTLESKKGIALLFGNQELFQSSLANVKASFTYYTLRN